jgi:hypothetical protein
MREFRQVMQDSAGPVHQMSRVMVKSGRDVAHDGPAIRDDNVILK